MGKPESAFDPAELRWYAVHTRVRGERLAQITITEAGYETLYPHYLGTIKHARRHIAVLKPLFPRYLFVAVEPGQSLYGVNTALGVSTVLYDDTGPLRVPLREIERIRARCDETGRVDAPKRKREVTREAFKHGAPVNITEGPLKGLPGTIERDDGGETVDVALTFLGRPIVASIPAHALVFQVVHQFEFGLGLTVSASRNRRHLLAVVRV